MSLPDVVTRMRVACIAAVAVAVLLPSTASGQSSSSPGKVTICHVNANRDRYSPITISVKAAPAHVRHGDFAASQLQGRNVFAIAYTELDGVPGYGLCDVLIAAIVDENENSTLDSPDRVHLGSYPTSFTSPYGFEPWAETSYLIGPIAFTETAAIVKAVCCESQFRFTSDSQIHSFASNSEFEFFSVIRDCLATDVCQSEGIQLDPFSPGRPQPLNLTRPTREGDDPFVDTAVFYPFGRVLVP